MPLGRALIEVVRVGEVVSPAELAERVRAAGYRTSAKNFSPVVSQALAKERHFRKVTRGRYERVG